MARSDSVDAMRVFEKRQSQQAEADSRMPAHQERAKYFLLARIERLKELQKKHEKFDDAFSIFLSK
jgi:hypothetical protein